MTKYVDVVNTLLVYHVNFCVNFILLYVSFCSYLIVDFLTIILPPWRMLFQFTLWSLNTFEDVKVFQCQFKLNAIIFPVF